MLCAARGEAVVRYALDGPSTPVGVAAWASAPGNIKLVERAPATLDLPHEAIRQGFARIVRAHADEIAAVEEAAAAEDRAAQETGGTGAERSG